MRSPGPHPQLRPRPRATAVPPRGRPPRPACRPAASARASGGTPRAHPRTPRCPPPRSGDARRRMRAPQLRSLEGGLDPVHVRAQLAADVLDLAVGLLRAHALEVLLPGAV